MNRTYGTPTDMSDVVMVDDRFCRLCPRTARLEAWVHDSWWLGAVVLPSSSVFDRAARALGVTPVEASKGKGFA